MNTFMELAQSRYSVRKYDSRQIEAEKIAAILQAAALAPTACNYQPQKIYVVSSSEKRAALASVCRCTFDAPVIFVVGYDEERRAKGMVSDDHDFGDTDSAIVCTHMMLEAAELGLGTCWVGMFREAQIQEVLGIPASIRIRHLLPTGYPAVDCAPSPMHAKSREQEDMVTFL